MHVNGKINFNQQQENWDYSYKKTKNIFCYENYFLYLWKFYPCTYPHACGEIEGDLTFLKGNFPYYGWGKIFGLIPSYPGLYLPHLLSGVRGVWGQKVNLKNRNVKNAFVLYLLFEDSYLKFKNNAS